MTAPHDHGPVFVPPPNLAALMAAHLPPGLMDGELPEVPKLRSLLIRSFLVGVFVSGPTCALLGIVGTWLAMR